MLFSVLRDLCICISSVCVREYDLYLWSYVLYDHRKARYLTKVMHSRRMLSYCVYQHLKHSGLGSECWLYHNNALSYRNYIGNVKSHGYG